MKAYCKFSFTHRCTVQLTSVRFIVYPRPRNARRDQPAFKVKSVLKSIEYECECIFSLFIIVLSSHITREVSKQELVPFLLQQIADQKRIDATLSGAPIVTESTQALAASKEATGPEVQLVLQGDAKKQRKQTKQMYMDRGTPVSRRSLLGLIDVL